MAKKNLTIKKKRNKARKIKNALFVSEFVSITTPYVIMGAENFNEWFVLNPESWKVCLGGIMAIALMSMAVLLVAKKKENSQLTVGYISLIVGWYAVAFVFLMLAKILNEIYVIMAYGGLGMLGAFGLDIGSKSFKNKEKHYTQALKQAQEQVDKEQAINEINEK